MFAAPAGTTFSRLSFMPEDAADPDKSGSSSVLKMTYFSRRNINRIFKQIYGMLMSIILTHFQKNVSVHILFTEYMEHKMT